MLPIQRLDYMAWYMQNYLDHQEDYRSALRQLDRPATFFIGEGSKLYPAQGQKLIASSVPHAKTVIFKKIWAYAFIRVNRANSSQRNYTFPQGHGCLNVCRLYQPNDEYFYNS